MVESYHLSADAARRIFAAVRAWETGRVVPNIQPGYEQRTIIPQPPWEFGKLKTSLTASGSATIDIYTTANGSTWTDTTEDLLIYAPPLLSSGSIATGKWVRAGYHYRSGLWFPISAEC